MQIPKSYRRAPALPNSMAFFERLLMAAAAQTKPSQVIPCSFPPRTAQIHHLHSRSKEKTEEEQEVFEGESIGNRSYWRKKIHSLCAIHGDVDEALRLLDRLRLRGYRPDSLNLASVVHALCAAGRSEEAHRRLLLSAAAGWLPDDRTANVLFARLLDAGTPLLTLQVVRCLTDAKPAFVPSLTNYNRLIDQLSSQSQPVEARSLLLDMRSKGRLPNAVSYTALINGFARTGELDHARQMFDEMLEAGIPPNSLTHSVLIKAVLRKRRVDEGREMLVELWRKMQDEREPSVNGAAFANLIDALCREGFFHEVFRIAEEMPQGDSIDQLFAYGQMMDSLCRVGKYHGASRIVYIMRKRGFIPGMASYNHIVHGLSKEKGCMRAYQLFKEGTEFGYSPSESTYKVLVEGLCREKDINKAQDVAEFVLQRDAVDRTRIYNIFLSALRLADNPSEQLNVLVSMLQKQCQPDVVTLNTVIHGFCKIGKVDEAKRILDDMLNGNISEPDVVTFTTIIRGLLDVGRPEESLDVLRNTMPAHKCAPSVVTYNVVLQGLTKLRKVDEAMRLFYDMIDKGFAADSTTYTVVVEGLCSVGRLAEAKRIWDDIIWPSQIHDHYVYGAILRGLCCSGKLAQACDFLYELVDCGVDPGIVNYNIVIDCACRMGLKKEAYQIVGEMRKNGVRPDAVTWRILGKLHEEGGKECIISNQNSELNWIVDLPEEFHESKIERDGDMLEGLTDSSFSGELIEDEVSEDDRVGKNAGLIGDAVNLGPKEPLSRIARRIFGLL
ncbi:pentatricopeptide repeat-containing protein At3g18020-like [Musa acuminata AAA Group]|uniref:pentatricopeptide repeat-containing protein At3g18020-like n=1 Tax=Musa acuminata AAA Group TaxID=214697 RepID=UPI0031D10B08